MNAMPGIDMLQLYEGLVVGLRKWKPQIEEALEHGLFTHSYGDVVQMIMSNRLSLFLYEDAFMVMEVIQYPQYKVWHCFLAGGNHDTIVGTEDQMTEIALNLGCKYLSYSGRKGWDKDARKRGWDFVCTTMYKSVVRGDHGQGF